MRKLQEGIELFEGSKDVWIAEFGDPFHPAGIPPNPPWEGATCYVDPDRGHLLVLHHTVQLPPADRFVSDLDPCWRERLAQIEPELRRLTGDAIRSAPSLSVVDQEEAWPALLRGDAIFEVEGVCEASAQEIECKRWDLERASENPEPGPAFAAERDRLRRILDACPLSRVSYGRPPSEEYPGPEVWLAPEAGLSWVDDSILHVTLLDNPCVRRVAPYGARDRATRDRLSRIEHEASTAIDLVHAERLLREDPRVRAIIQVLQSNGHQCRRCGSVIRGARAVQRDNRGALRLHCWGCLGADPETLPGVCWGCGKPKAAEPGPASPEFAESLEWRLQSGGLYPLVFGSPGCAGCGS